MKNPTITRDGRIVVADDQPINLQVLTSQLAEFGQAENCDFCYNGEDAFTHVVEILENAIENNEEQNQIRPIHLMLLDF